MTPDPLINLDRARRRLRAAEARLSALAAEIADPMDLTERQQAAWDAAWSARREALSAIRECLGEWTTAA
ncbi:hypothetical protein [Actinomadura rupiterrae]|uniref:hypothetical protein n=1 Tax=Actinomadura rupiterrae TaxID=559627 RepID=UPI0020A38376|nr:hypothetical protein [Actinomadura rupiterrae]MCP2339146.1 hypothetical protein [Actinomadura rupiterrae]